MTLFKLLLMSLRAFLYLDILIHIHSFISILRLSLLAPCIPLIVSFFHLSPPLGMLIKRLLGGQESENQLAFPFPLLLPLPPLLLLLAPSPSSPPSSVTHYPCGFSAAVALSEKMLTYSCPSFVSFRASFEDQVGVNAC